MRQKKFIRLGFQQRLVSIDRIKILGILVRETVKFTRATPSAAQNQLNRQKMSEYLSGAQNENRKNDP